MTISYNFNSKRLHIHSYAYDATWNKILNSKCSVLHLAYRWSLLFDKKFIGVSSVRSTSIRPHKNVLKSNQTNPKFKIKPKPDLLLHKFSCVITDNNYVICYFAEFKYSLKTL